MLIVVDDDGVHVDELAGHTPIAAFNNDSPSLTGSAHDSTPENASRNARKSALPN